MSQQLFTAAHPYLTSPLTWLALLFGLIVGSFLNVCIFRIPEGTFWKNQRSICLSCGAGIPFYLNVPVLSYLMLRGRTACCHSRLSPQYPLVEALTGLLFVLIYWKFPFVATYGTHWGIDWRDFLRFSHAAIFTCLLLVCAVIDLRLMIIPDVISLPMIALTPLVVYFDPELTWRSALLGVAVGGGSLYAIAWLYWLARREVGMGMGDVKLLAGIGGWLGYQGVLPTILYGSVTGAIVGLLAVVLTRRLSLRTAIPFGPFLALGAFVHLVFGAQIQEWFVLGGR